MKKLFLVLIVMFCSVCFGAVTPDQEKMLKEHIANTMRQRGLTPDVILTQVKAVDKSDFYIYSLTISDKEKGVENTQFILFNGSYLADDLVNPFENMSIIQNYEYESSNANVAYTKLSLLYGNKSAKYVVVEFADFQCSYCKLAYSYIDELAKNRKDVAVYIAHYPLPNHPKAMIMAQIFEAGILQNKNFATELFNNAQVHSMDDEALIEYFAGQVKNAKKFKTDVSSTAVAAKIQAGMDAGEKIRVASTPTLVINSKLIMGFNKSMIDRAFSEMK